MRAGRDNPERTDFSSHRSNSRISCPHLFGVREPGGTPIPTGLTRIRQIGSAAVPQTAHRPLRPVPTSPFSEFDSSSRLPVTAKTTRSQMLVTRSAMRSRLWAAQSRWVARLIVAGSAIM